MHSLVPLTVVVPLLAAALFTAAGRFLPPRVVDGLAVAVAASTWVKYVALRVEGPKITRVALFDPESAKWLPLDLDEPVNGVVQPMSLGSNSAAYQIGEILYLYNPKTAGWDRLDLRASDDDGKKGGPATKGRRTSEDDGKKGGPATEGR